MVIGTSLGGLRALRALLTELPADFPLPVVIVQHRDPHGKLNMTRSLEDYAALKISEAEDKEPLLPGHIYIAPANYHLLVDDDRLAVSTEAPVIYARPSIDVLFESAAETYGEHVIGVVLTGASSDGARGAAAIKAGGGMVVVQDPATAESRVMPNAAIAATHGKVLPLDEIGAFLTNQCSATAKGGTRTGRKGEHSNCG